MPKIIYFGHLIQRANSLEKTEAGEDWWQEEKGVKRMRWLDGITDCIDMSLSKLEETVKNKEAWNAVCGPGVTNSDTIEAIEHTCTQ